MNSSEGQSSPKQPPHAKGKSLCGQIPQLARQLKDVAGVEVNLQVGELQTPVQFQRDCRAQYRNRILYAQQWVMCPQDCGARYD